MLNRGASLAMSTSVLKAFLAILMMSTSVLKALPGKLAIKRHSPSFLYGPKASQCQQVFSKPCLVNLISKDTHLVSLYPSKPRDVNKNCQSLAW